ncbi:MAG: uroporphyrinogen decarboxylase family protein, partial [Spirochaetota bacterium]
MMPEPGDEKRDFLTRLWHLEDLPRPAYQINSAVQHETTMLERFQDPQKMLEAQLKEFEVNLRFLGDYVPALFPYLGTGIFASAFGCEVEWFEHKDPWAHPIIIITDDPRQVVYELEPPAVTDGLLGRVLDLTAFFREHTDGQYPIRMTDLQSPLGIAYQIWKSDQFLMAMYTAPREIHHLLELVTDLIIRFVKKQREMAGNFIPLHFPFVWMPDNYGIGISEDLLALIS